MQARIRLLFGTRDKEVWINWDRLLKAEGSHPIHLISTCPLSLSTGNKWNESKLVPYEEALSVLRQEYGSDLIPVHDEDGDGTSKRWKVKGWEGEIGFISSMVSEGLRPLSGSFEKADLNKPISCDILQSDHFCGTCNRLRITADGNLKVIL